MQANSHANRLTPWSNDSVSDQSGEIVYLRDDETGEIWTPTPLPIRNIEPYIIRHGQGYTQFEHTTHGIQQTLTHFVPTDECIKISLLKIKNVTKRKRKISVTSYTEWVLGVQREWTSPYLVCDLDSETNAIFARNPHDDEFFGKISFADISSPNRTYTCSRMEFLGRNGSYSNPAALKRKKLSQKRGLGQDLCAALQTTLDLEPGEEHEICILLGQADNPVSARALVHRYREIETAKKAFHKTTQHWDNLLNIIQIKTPDPAMNILMNRWILYQSLSCRYWGRTAFYQSGGAYGFRDQLQDCMAFVYSAPLLTREHIIRSASRQFTEGDVQHWWHPPSGRGVRTRISDDLLWLPFVVSFYVNVTGDHSILSEQVPFLNAPVLKIEEEDSYTLPSISSESASVFEHCLRAIDRSLLVGQHGLPLMGTGDWNDGMNRVGSLGKGESIWLGWFLYKVISDFLPFCSDPNQFEICEKYKIHLKNLKDSLEKEGWDGEWYKRAFFDDGSPLGSAINDECKIDSIAQSWAELSNAGDPLRTRQALKNVNENLIRKKSNIILLFSPPFDRSPRDPGYVKGYVPGVRENGGQYTHAAIWVMMAYAKQGDGNQAYELFSMLNPIFHSNTKLKSNKYKIEPYVIAADVYAEDMNEGRGGWSWYTGSASWYYRAGLESLLGFDLQGNKLILSPCIPNHWKEYEITYLFGKSKYLIHVKNPHQLSGGKIIYELDGVRLTSNEVNLLDDGNIHLINATIHLDSELMVVASIDSYNDQSKV